MAQTSPPIAQSALGTVFDRPVTLIDEAERSLAQTVSDGDGAPRKVRAACSSRSFEKWLSLKRRFVQKNANPNELRNQNVQCTDGTDDVQNRAHDTKKASFPSIGPLVNEWPSQFLAPLISTKGSDTRRAR
jgi:hypothetical protein